MWKKRIFSVLLTAMLILPSSAFAAENGEWLLPKIQDAPAFTDITGPFVKLRRAYAVKPAS